MATPQSNASSCGFSTISQTQVRATRVLLIEDKPSDAQLVRSALVDLRDRGLFGPIFTIISATRLPEAFTCLAHEEFDVILLDLSLPDSEGLEDTFNRIHRAGPGIPIIVMTGLGDKLLGLKLLRDGAQDYFDVAAVLKNREVEQQLGLLESKNEWPWPAVISPLSLRRMWAPLFTCEFPFYLTQTENSHNVKVENLDCGRSCAIARWP